MSKKKDNKKYPKGSGIAAGLIFGIVLAIATGNIGLFVIGIAIGVAIESTYSKK
jgi:hypothetical protein